MKISFIARALGAGLLVLSLSACAVNRTVAAQDANFSWSGANEKRIVVIQPDVHLGELTTGGLVEPRADWTKTAQIGIANQLKIFFTKRNSEIVMVDDLTDHHEIQLAKLHSPVGVAIMRHAIMKVKLPTKSKPMDWTLGPGVQALRDHYKADYGLFMYVNDTYSSAGRALLVALGGATGGMQIGFASLVDLRTGNVIWFNLRNDGSGDLRNDKGAKGFVEGILTDLPK